MLVVETAAAQAHLVEQWLVLLRGTICTVEDN